MRHLFSGFLAGFLAVLTVHQAVIAAGGALGFLPGATGWSMRPVPPLGIPQLLSLAFWGGIWGILFLLPLTKQNTFLRGLIFSLGPTLVQLFVIFPYKLNKGMMGIDLGTWTPLFVFFFNAIWGWTTALWLKWTGK